MPALLEFKNISKKFGDITALDDVSFTIDEGELVLIAGPSGAGKTTILRLLIREVKPSSGEVFFDEKAIHDMKKKKVPKLRQKIGAVFQDYKLLENRTVSENVQVVLAIIGIKKEGWKNRVTDVLNLVGLADRADYFPSQLSGGELQRAGLARALVVNPKLIFADEPTGNLDWDAAEGVMKLLTKINSEGKTVIVATHNKKIIKDYGKKVIELKKGKLVKK